MAERKTQLTGADVGEFLDGVENPKRREDARVVMEMMAKVTKLEPEMWGQSIIGFGRVSYTLANGREEEICAIGLSPRKASLTLYIAGGFPEFKELLGKLGKHKKSTACIYINKLEDVHLPTLRTLIRMSMAHLKKKSKG